MLEEHRAAAIQAASNANTALRAHFMSSGPIVTLISTLGIVHQTPAGQPPFSNGEACGPISMAVKSVSTVPPPTSVGP